MGEGPQKVKVDYFVAFKIAKYCQEQADGTKGILFGNCEEGEILEIIDCLPKSEKRNKTHFDKIKQTLIDSKLNGLGTYLLADKGTLEISIQDYAKDIYKSKLPYVWLAFNPAQSFAGLKALKAFKVTQEGLQFIKEKKGNVTFFDFKKMKKTIVQEIDVQISRSHLFQGYLGEYYPGPHVNNEILKLKGEAYLGRKMLGLNKSTGQFVQDQQKIIDNKLTVSNLDKFQKDQANEAKDILQSIFRESSLMFPNSEDVAQFSALELCKTHLLMNLNQHICF
eukprot:TRINITY_DN11271_c0_g1_i1.p1 TRINITY_DN11271_c0_g1~~TRINITY_DN11271_c0_g1_i1.p1  ORF type:complete len:280 (-),score=38.84 TRINITY_DN11271_c0_g1_i1:17-856(-)